MVLGIRASTQLEKLFLQNTDCNNCRRQWAAREFLASLRVPSWFFDLMVDREWNATHAPILDKRADGDADERGESEQGPDAAPRKGEGVAASKRKLTQSDSTQGRKGANAV